MAADFNFNSSPLLTFHEEEHVYRERVERERPYALDAALFAVHGVILVKTSASLSSGAISQNYVLLLNFIVAFLAVASVFYLLPGTNATVLKYQRTLRLPFHVCIDILNAIIFVSFDKITKSAVSSPLWPDYFAIEAFVAHLIWPMCYPILAAMPLAVAMPVQLVVGSIYISNNNNMCRNAMKMYPQTKHLYTLLQKVLSRIAISLRFSASNYFISKALGKKSAVAVAALENDHAACSNILLVLEVSMVVLILFYVLFISELDDRQVYCAVAGKRVLQGELQRRRPYAWQLLGEAVLAWIVLWNVVMLISNDWNLGFF
ncbi:hypothetical protein Ndes2437B_g08081 [Nannochloris sp. 'desiccata']